jgi:hypothetical protein
MADVEMTDAGAAPKVAKSAKAGASGTDSKKDKFEVKKVWHTPSSPVKGTLLTDCYSGTPSRSGLGTSLSTTAPSAVTTSWICASTVKPTKLLLRLKSALSPGESAT